ncbi:RNA-directed DNA polymerase, eukaryota, Reverse transcriptase zinc-binding domain protein [Artemisia annua]|uniref:RNA-directed DNA polymerase, eukaryota, Reverse transcriptase zinc-binding domain protein n=1 Tax=Artemisia annua TaxID=35608 RepID=A0A2U1NIG9_ARTAN|nr:RNA-directed DNA polymerase, eukaryota, Reverse transcriptase zinc-binding domain protein [Artemisia annua]
MSANKYSILEESEVNEQSELENMRNKEIVDEFLRLQKEPTEIELSKWNVDMIGYFNKSKEIMRGKVKEKMADNSNKEEVNDVYQEESRIGSWNIRGLSTTDKQNEVMNFIENEQLSICAILETHLKTSKIQRIGDRIFGMWEWTDNLRMCDKGCKVMLGWNQDKVSVTMVHIAKVLCKVRTVTGNIGLFCTFVYAANGGVERRILWKDLCIYKRIVEDKAWVLIWIHTNICSSPEWGETVSRYAAMDSGNNIKSIIRRLSFAPSVYLIWKERNCRLFRDEKRSVEDLFELFCDIIKLRLAGMKVKPTPALLRAQKEWNVKMVMGKNDV